MIPRTIDISSDEKIKSYVGEGAELLKNGAARPAHPQGEGPMKERPISLKNPLKCSMAGLLVVMMVSMILLPSGVVSADNFTVNITNMPGSAGDSIALKYGEADLVVESNSWSPSSRTCSFFAHAYAFPDDQTDAGVISEIHALGVCTFTITTAGTHHINVDYDVDVWLHTYFLDSDEPGQIFLDMYMDLRNSAGVRVTQDWDMIIHRQVSTTNPAHYVMTPTHTIAVNLATGTYTLYVGICTSLNASSYSVTHPSFAWSQGSWSIEDVSITT